MKEFKIISDERSSYTVVVEDFVGMDEVWDSEKAYYMPGTDVVIKNQQTEEIRLFVKES